MYKTFQVENSTSANSSASRARMASPTRFVRPRSGTAPWRIMASMRLAKDLRQKLSDDKSADKPSRFLHVRQLIRIARFLRQMQSSNLLEDIPSREFHVRITPVSSRRLAGSWRRSHSRQPLAQAFYLTHVLDILSNGKATPGFPKPQNRYLCCFWVLALGRSVSRLTG